MGTTASRKAPLLIAVMFSLLAAGSAWAGGTVDCPPVGHLPSYEPGNGSMTTRDFDARDFDVQKGDGTVTVSVAGQTCDQRYFLKDGAEEMSDLEVQMNYRQQLSQLGAQLLSTSSDHYTTAKIVKGSEETWVYVQGGGREVDVTVVHKQPIKLTLTAPSGKDYRLIGHMPNYTLGSVKKRNFDRMNFDVQNGAQSQSVDVMGATFEYRYFPDKKHPPQSDLAIQTNYREALKKMGAQILYTSKRETTARYDDKGQPIWIQISSGEEIDVSVLEEKSFQATIQPPKADAMKTALDKDGHLALYIHFDFNKATLRPDAKPIIDQVIALMKNNPDLKLEVDGNTDNIGGHDYNMKLSQDRAASVVAAVVKGGIDAGRLKSAGFGPDKPIADNTKPEGRAKNRRVELVKL